MIIKTFKTVFLTALLCLMVGIYTNSANAQDLPDGVACVMEDTGRFRLYREPDGSISDVQFYIYDCDGSVHQWLLPGSDNDVAPEPTIEWEDKDKSA